MRKLFGGVAAFLGLAWCTGGSLTPSAEAYPLTEAQRERLQKYIPRTFARLEAQKPVHIVSLGDSVTMIFTPDETNGNTLLSYQGQFADLLSQEFFYPGGVRVRNPAGEHPEKLNEHLGQEIFLENLADGGTIGLDIFQPLAAKAFLHDPDLMIINFGINDAARGQSVEVFRGALQSAANFCRQKKVDLIIMGSSLARISPGPTEWGLTRPYATVASEVAEANGLLFVDLGRANARILGGVPPRTDTDTAIDGLAEQIAGMFTYNPPLKNPERLHPNEAAHKKMGRAFFETLMNGPPEDVISLDAQGTFVSEDTVEVRLSLRNPSQEPRNGHIGALAVGRFLYPETPNFAFNLKPGENRQVKLVYKRFERDAFGKRSDGGPRFTPVDIGDPYLRLSYLVVDEDQSDLVDVVTRLQPVGVSFTDRRINEVTDKVRIEWQFVNGTNKAMNARYRIGLGKDVSDFVDFSLPALGANEFEARFPFKPPPGVVRIKYPLFLEIEANGVKYAFHREMEATRDLGLGENIALSPQTRYGNEENSGSQVLDAGQKGVTVQTDANASALFFTLDFKGLDFVQRPQSWPMIADFYVDARGPDRVRKFGFVHRLQIRTGTEDGPATVIRPQMGTFGESYNMVLFEEGFKAELETLSDGKTRRLHVAIPRQYLYRHPWKLNNPDSLLGLNVIVTMSAIKPDTGMAHHPSQQGFVLTRPSREVGMTMYQCDPRGFATLRLSNGPHKTWSAWLY